MSRLLRNEGASHAARVGSFVVRRGHGGFQPSHEGPSPGNDFAPMRTNGEETDAEADAFARGYEEGHRTAEAELAAERDAIARLAESLATLRPEPTNALALLLAETVDRLVREIIGSVDIDATLLLERAKAAAALIGESVEPSELRVHPRDAELLKEVQLDVTVVADPSLARGSIVLRTGHGWVEDGPEVRLERLRTELDRIAASK